MALSQGRCPPPSGGIQLPGGSSGGKIESVIHRWIGVVSIVMRALYWSGEESDP